MHQITGITGGDLRDQQSEGDSPSGLRGHISDDRLKRSFQGAHFVPGETQEKPLVQFQYVVVDRSPLLPTRLGQLSIEFVDTTVGVGRLCASAAWPSGAGFLTPFTRR